MPGDTVLSGPDREPFPWNVVVGVLLMGVAVWFILNPDHPMARGSMMDTSAFLVDELAPRAAYPIGDVDASELEFAWTWSGPACDASRVLVLDSRFSEIYASSWGAVDSPVSAPAELRAKLVAGRRYHWQVELDLATPIESGRHADRRRFRSGPAAFVSR